MTKILFYDIETAPNLSYVWGHYEQNVIDHQREWYMLCVSWRWEHEKNSQSVGLPAFADAYTANPENDFHIVKLLWDLFNEADIVIAHNGDKFDMRKANARFIAHGLGPAKPVRQIDTLKVARKYFAFNSNKLDDLGKHLKVGQKLSTNGFATWAGCMRGDTKSWTLMLKYAKQDVELLRKVYLKLRPWMTNHPNLNVFSGAGSCPTCGETDMQRRGLKYSQVSAFQQWQCNKCKAYFRTRVAESGTRPDLVP